MLIYYKHLGTMLAGSRTGKCLSHRTDTLLGGADTGAVTKRLQKLRNRPRRTNSSRQDWVGWGAAVRESFLEAVPFELSSGEEWALSYGGAGGQEALEEDPAFENPLGEEW